jgi:hypothetical protein
MAEKTTGLAAFTQKKPPQAENSPSQSETPLSSHAKRRRRGTRETVALSVRLPRAGWERLHQLAVSEGESIQTLSVRGLNKIFAEKGLPGIEL